MTRDVTGAPAPGIGHATVILARDGRRYAAGTDTGGRIRLTEKRPITSGRYTLTIRQAGGSSPAAGRGAATPLNTIVPIAVR